MSNIFDKLKKVKENMDENKVKELNHLEFEGPMNMSPQTFYPGQHSISEINEYNQNDPFQKYDNIKKDLGPINEYEARKRMQVPIDSTGAQDFEYQQKRYEQLMKLLRK